MGNPKDIFKSHSLLTEKEISDYLNGNLSEEQKKIIENKFSQDEFNADALEGLESNPVALAGYESARETVLKNIDKKSGGWQFHHTMMLAVVAVVAMLVIGSKLFPDSGYVEYVPPVAVQDSTEQQLPIVENQELEEEITDIEIEEAIELPEIHLVKAKEIIAESPVVLDTVIIDSDTVSNMTYDETVELKKVDPIAAPDKIVVPTKDKIVYSNAPVIYTHKFLMVDYGKIYTKQPTIQKLEFSGTSAALENKDDVLNEGQVEDDIITKEIPYKEYMAETQLLFGKNDFKSALKRYRVVIKAYPEDLNAHFYSALCYYNIGKYSLAHKHFDLAEKHAYNTFKIDAQWYNAKTFYMEKKDEECKKVLEKIIEDNDYYASQAAALLKKLK
jgi:tetratricopeptide (TPR) repeat protein